MKQKKIRTTMKVIDKAIKIKHTHLHIITVVCSFYRLCFHQPSFYPNCFIRFFKLRVTHYFKLFDNIFMKKKGF